MTFTLGTILVGALLLLIQALAALPWLALLFLNRAQLTELRRKPFAQPVLVTVTVQVKTYGLPVMSQVVLPVMAGQTLV